MYLISQPLPLYSFSSNLKSSFYIAAPQETPLSPLPAPIRGNPERSSYHVDMGFQYKQ